MYYGGDPPAWIVTPPISADALCKDESTSKPNGKPGECLSPSCLPLARPLYCHKAIFSQISVLQTPRPCCPCSSKRGALEGQRQHNQEAAGGQQERRRLQAGEGTD